MSRFYYRPVDRGSVLTGVGQGIAQGVQNYQTQWDAKRRRKDEDHAKKVELHGLIDQMPDIDDHGTQPQGQQQPSSPGTGINFPDSQHGPVQDDPLVRRWQQSGNNMPLDGPMDGKALMQVPMNQQGLLAKAITATQQGQFIPLAPPALPDPTVQQAERQPIEPSQQTPTNLQGLDVRSAVGSNLSIEGVGQAQDYENTRLGQLQDRGDEMLRSTVDSADPLQLGITRFGEGTGEGGVEGTDGTERVPTTRAIPDNLADPGLIYEDYYGTQLPTLPSIRERNRVAARRHKFNQESTAHKLSTLGDGENTPVEWAGILEAGPQLGGSILTGQRTGRDLDRRYDLRMQEEQLKTLGDLQVVTAKHKASMNLESFKAIHDGVKDIVNSHLKRTTDGVMILNDQDRDIALAALRSDQSQLDYREALVASIVGVHFMDANRRGEFPEGTTVTDVVDHLQDIVMGTQVEFFDLGREGAEAAEYQAIAREIYDNLPGRSLGAWSKKARYDEALDHWVDENNRRRESEGRRAMTIGQITKFKVTANLMFTELSADRGAEFPPESGEPRR